MTIRIDRDLLLRILSAPPRDCALDPTSIHCQVKYEYIEKPEGPNRLPDEDDDSVYTASTAALSCDADDVDADDVEYDKRVSFADTLVTDQWTREYTAREDVGCLYYSSDEIQRLVFWSGVAEQASAESTPLF